MNIKKKAQCSEHHFYLYHIHIRNFCKRKLRKVKTERLMNKSLQKNSEFELTGNQRTRRHELSRRSGEGTVPSSQRPQRAGTPPIPSSDSHWDKEYSFLPLAGSHLKVALRSQSQSSRRLLKLLRLPWSFPNNPGSLPTLNIFSSPSKSEWQDHVLVLDLTTEQRLYHLTSCLTLVKWPKLSMPQYHLL